MVSFLVQDWAEVKSGAERVRVALVVVSAMIMARVRNVVPVLVVTDDRT